MSSECPNIVFATDKAQCRFQFVNQGILTPFSPCRIVVGEIDPANPASFGVIACDTCDAPRILLTTVISAPLRFACEEENHTITFIDEPCRFICQFTNALDFLELLRIFTVAKTFLVSQHEKYSRKLDLIYAHQFEHAISDPTTSDPGMMDQSHDTIAQSGAATPAGASAEIRGLAPCDALIFDLAILPELLATVKYRTRRAAARPILSLLSYMLKAPLLRPDTDVRHSQPALGDAYASFREEILG
ncbi:hypothetical protein BV20DRAFT_1049750 [Pilatotrama ljubarskyi]|nr:hypothetical protein BV20DRAFT_1049750 [Pilatotrama ljubarskyi]